MSDAMTLSALLGGPKKTRKVVTNRKKSARIGATVRLHNTGTIHTIVSRDAKYKAAFNLSDVPYSMSRDTFEVV